MDYFPRIKVHDRMHEKPDVGIENLLPSQGSVNWTQKGEERVFKVTQGIQQSHFPSADEVFHIFLL